MSLAILGKKIGMTRIFDEKGKVIPVTVVEAGHCPILQVKNVATDGYCAVQYGFDPKAERKETKPQLGHLAKTGSKPVRRIKEFRIDDTKDFEPGGVIDVGRFDVGDIVDVSGIGKGRGFAGAIKRHGSSRGPESHGSRYHRRPGSLGPSATPSHVLKGKPLPGQMGAKKVTIRKLRIAKIDKERNLLIIHGAIPGPNSGYVVVSKRN